MIVREQTKQEVTSVDSGNVETLSVKTGIFP